MSTASTISVVDPGQPGDFLLAMWERDGFGSAPTAPDGTWALLFSGYLYTDDATFAIWYKFPAAGVGGTLTFTEAITDMGLVVAAWGSVDSTTPFDGVVPVSVINDDARASPAAIPAPSVTPTTPGATAIFLGVCDPTSNTPSSDAFAAPGGYMSRVAFFDASGWNILLLADAVVSAATGVVSGTVTRAGANFGVFGAQIVLRPSATSGGIIVGPVVYMTA